MDMKQWLDSQYGCKRKKTMPILSFPSTALMGINVRELIADSALQAKGMKMIADKVDSAASVSMMDLSVEAEAFGGEVRYFDDDVPSIVGSIVQTQEDADALKVPKMGAGRTGRYVDTIKRACDLITDRPVFAGVIGPFSLAGRVIEVTEIMMMCLEEPEIVHAVLRKGTDFLIEYAQAYKAAGASGIILAEPLTGLISPAMAEEFSEPYAKEMIDALQDDNFLMVYHNCGASVTKMVDSLVRLNAAAYHFGNSISMKEMMELLPSNVVAMGNVDPATQFHSGTPDSIRKVTKQIMSECCKYPNFSISSGCDIPAMSKWENITAYFDAVKEYYDENNM